jgi:hypothetical protein
VKKWVIAAAALVIFGIPVAYAAAPSSQQQEPARAQTAETNAAALCKAERSRIGVGAFETKYGTNPNKANAFGKCVSSKSKDDKDEKDEDEKDQGDKDGGADAKACKAERASMGAEAFGKKYGTNHNLKNAFGKCVSGKSKAKNKTD